MLSVTHCCLCLTMQGTKTMPENIAHYIALNLQFCHKYVFLLAEKVIKMLAFHDSKKSKQIIGILH